MHHAYTVHGCVQTIEYLNCGSLSVLRIEIMIEF